MPRPRKSPLPRGITARATKRGVTYAIAFADQTGIVRRETAGPDLREAQRLIAQRRAEVREGRYRPDGSKSGETTIAKYAEDWLAERKGDGVRSIATIDGHVRNHITPALGAKRLVGLRPIDVAEWVDAMKRTGELSAKSIINVHGTLHAMLEHARFRELVVANVASLPRGMLPKKGRKKAPRFDRNELVVLLTDERIDWHRRIFYALQALGGLRCGEASGRRWRDLDTEAPGLACLTVATQYDDRPLKTAKDEDVHERLVPVHPALAAMLAEWRLNGYSMTYGRPPSSDDWICADPTTGKPRTREQAGNALYRDLERVGIPRKLVEGRQGRRTHAFRRAFISLARSEGAIPDHLEVVTHNSAGAVIDAYTSLEWSALCTAVRALRIELRRGQVIELPRPIAASAEGSELHAVLHADSESPENVGKTHGGVGNRTVPRSATALDFPRTSGKEQGRASPQKSRGSRSVPRHVTQVKLAEALRRAERILRRGGHAEEADAVAALLAAPTPDTRT